MRVCRSTFLTIFHLICCDGCRLGHTGVIGAFGISGAIVAAGKCSPVFGLQVFHKSGCTDETGKHVKLVTL